MRTIELLVFLLMMPLLIGCADESFTVEGELEGLGTQNVRVTYAGDDGVSTQVITAEKGRFTFAGCSSSPTVVDFADAQGTLLARVAACNGDRVTIKGNAKHPELATVSGSPANEQWSQFRTSHTALYARRPCAELDHAIEQWVRAHPGEVASTLLLLCDHSTLLADSTQLPLLTSINPEARPKQLITAFEALANYYSRNAATTLRTLTLCGTSGDFETLSLDRRPTVIYCWSVADGDRTACVAACREMAEKDILVADVLLDADTAGWMGNRADAGSKVQHYWSPTGPMNATLKPLRIAATPWFIVADSVGRITYRGSSATEAQKALP
ncbi:MAG: DUF4369 domain-containing protein [Muribaculaceae bacterium]|nr:DUF4369 domain-containing protein [Muribaculaceae bacterium]